MTKTSLFILLVLGIIFRLFLINLNSQPLIYDQQDYIGYARNILSNGLHAQTARTYGYPLIIASVFKVNGENNIEAVKIIQVFLDSFTALFIFLIASRLFKNTIPALISYLLYLFNPWSSVYTGVLLSENSTIFLVGAVFFLLVEYLSKEKMVYIFLLGLFSGYLVQVRPVYLYFSLFMMVISFLIIKKAYFKITLIIIFLLPFVYTVVGNLRYFKQFSLVTVDNLGVRELYLSLFLDNVKTTDTFPPEVSYVYGEYNDKPKDKIERKLMAQKYLGLSLDKINKDPAAFVRQRVYKAYHIWGKDMLYPYNDLIDNKLIWFLSQVNNLIVLLASVGVVIFTVKYRLKSRVHQWFIILSIAFFLYTTVIYMFSVAEQRYTLPAYPLLFNFASLGVWEIFNLRKK